MKQNDYIKRGFWLLVLCIALAFQSMGQDCSTFIISSVSVDHISCNGLTNGRIIVEVAGGEAPYQYSIDNGSSYVSFNGNAVMIAGLAGGAYGLKVRDSNLCEVSYMDNPVEVNEPDILEIELKVTQTGCPDDGIGEIEALVFGGTLPYTYFWSNGGTTNLISGLPEGNYSCTVTDIFACKTDETIEYEEYQEVLVDAGEDLNILPGESIQINAMVNIQDISIIQWVPTSGLNNASILNPVASPVVTTMYELFILSADGCTGSDQVIISVLSAVEGVIVPNAFSPNDDELNDLFRPILTTGVDFERMYVFNRWGQLVFRSSSSLGWDGRYLGVDQPVGTYLYRIDYLNVDGEIKQLSGEVNLIR